MQDRIPVLNTSPTKIWRTEWRRFLREHILCPWDRKFFTAISLFSTSTPFDDMTVDKRKTNLSANFKISPEENRRALAKYRIHIRNITNKTAVMTGERWYSHDIVKDHKSRHDDGVRFRVERRPLQYHGADVISLAYDRKWSDFNHVIEESLQYNPNIQQKGKLSQDKTMWQTLGDLGHPVFRRFLNMIRRLDMDIAMLVIIASLLIPSVEAMPQGILDNPPDHSRDTRRIAWVVRLVPGIAAVGAVRQGNILRCIQDEASAFKSWLSRMYGTIIGIFTLLHCVAWVVIVGLIDQGRSDLLKV